MGYQPFLISELKTGAYDYLEPWIRAQDAFEPLTNAQVYRGSLLKRNGYTVLARPVYRDCNNALTGFIGNNVAGPYTGTITKTPIVKGSVIIKTMSAPGVFKTATDNGAGKFTGDVLAPPSGSIDYITGIVSLTFDAVIPLNQPMMVSYAYMPTKLTPAVVNPIMAIQTHLNESTGVQKSVWCDTRRAFVLQAGGTGFDPINSVKQVIWNTSKTGNKLGVGPTVFASGFTKLGMYTVYLTELTTAGVSTTIGPADDLGVFPAGGNFAAGSTVNYTSGDFSVELTGAADSKITATFQLQGDYFTGDNTDFFNATNWQSELYLTNSVDRITTYDGADLARPAFILSTTDYPAYLNGITTCLDLDVYKNRLLVQRPTPIAKYAEPYSDNQSIRWSQQNIPNNLATDTPGNGGELSAPTGDVIRSSEFLRDQLIVQFSKSHWLFRFTNDYNNPFRWDKLNSTKSVDAPYGTIAYDERVTACGKTGFVACDGVNVQRYDLNVLDWTTEDPEISNENFAQTFGLRFDTLNQSWMLFADYTTNLSENQSNKAFIFNFLENTWAIYNIPMSVIGTFFLTDDATWDSFAVGQPNEDIWQDADYPWTSYLLSKDAPTLFGGGHNGIGYVLNKGVVDMVSEDETKPIASEVTTTRWNPFLKEAQKVQFGYIDFYYEVNANTKLDLVFCTNNVGSFDYPALTRSIWLTSDQSVGSTPNNTYAMKRVYLNLVGEFLQMNIKSSSESNFKISGFILWAKPAGRLTP